MSEKIEFDIFVRFSSAARARVKISDGPCSTLLLVACETRISYLHRPDARPPPFPPLILPSSRVKGWWHSGVRESEDENSGRTGRNAKWQLRLRSPRLVRRKLSERGLLSRKKSATELFKSRPIRKPSPAILPCVTLLRQDDSLEEI